MLYIVPFYIVLMVFLVVLFVVPQRVLKYQLEGQELRIQYWYGHCSINLQNSKLEIVRVKTAWRSFGISTGFYNAGLFRVNSEDVRIYGTNLEDGVVLIRRAKNITLITPADPHEFLRLVSRV